MKYEPRKILKVLEALYSMIKGMKFIRLFVMRRSVALNIELAIEIWDSC